MLVQLKILNVDKTASKRLPNGSRDEETVKINNKTQGKSFLILFLSKIEFRTYYFCLFSYIF